MIVALARIQTAVMATADGSREGLLSYMRRHNKQHDRTQGTMCFLTTQSYDTLINPNRQPRRMGGEESSALRSTRVVSLVAEGFFRKKIEDALRNVGCRDTIEHRFCDSLTDTRAARPTMVLLDLEHPHALTTLREFGVNVVAFGPYMNDELRAIANTFVATVYCRTEFFEQLQQRLRPYAP